MPISGKPEIGGSPILRDATLRVAPQDEAEKGGGVWVPTCAGTTEERRTIGECERPRGYFPWNTASILLLSVCALNGLTI
jgi:hypothetical protein